MNSKHDPEGIPATLKAVSQSEAIFREDIEDVMNRFSWEVSSLDYVFNFPLWISPLHGVQAKVRNYVV